MRTRRGRPRELTRRQIRQVLRWHRCRRDFQTHIGSLRAFSKRSGISIHDLRRALAGDTTGLAALSPAQCRLLTRWLGRYREFSQHNLTAGELAAELGVTRNTVYDCIRRQGRYQRSPRGAARLSQHVRVGPARLSQQATTAEIAARAAALKQWTR